MGVANVLSTQNKHPFFLAIRASAAISETFRVGLLGVSSQINLVAGVMAFSTAAASAVFTSFT